MLFRLSQFGALIAINDDATDFNISRIVITPKSL